MLVIFLKKQCCHKSLEIQILTHLGYYDRNVGEVTLINLAVQNILAIQFN